MWVNIHHIYIFLSMIHCYILSYVRQYEHRISPGLGITKINRIRGHLQTVHAYEMKNIPYSRQYSTLGLMNMTPDLIYFGNLQ